MIDVNFGMVFGKFLDCSFRVSSVYCGSQEIHEIECFSVKKYSKVKVVVLGDKSHISQNDRSYVVDEKLGYTFDNVLFIAIHDSITEDLK